MRVIFFSALLFAASCSTASDNLSALRDREWRLVSLTAYEALPTGGAAPTIRFDAEGRMEANTGCNSGSANYTAAGGKLSFEMFAMTRRACLDPARNALESSYLQALESVAAYRINGSQLEMIDSSGVVVARFE